MSDRLRALLPAIVQRAKLAPSVHNTQPVRWHLGDGGLWLLADPSRYLEAADPDRRDALCSVGTALEGTLLALGESDLAAVEIVDCAAGDETSPVAEFDAVARLAVRPAVGSESPGAMNAALAGRATHRHTHRGCFGPATVDQMRGLQRSVASNPGVSVVSGPSDIEVLARLNDAASLRFLSRANYRHELLDWMRFDDRSMAWHRDGLARDALGMGRLEAALARRFLGSSLFDVAVSLGLARSLISERKATCSASAVILLHAPLTESPLLIGRVLYRTWLTLDALGLVVWPMAAVADDVETAADCAERFGIQDGRRLRAVLRVGRPASGFLPRRVRLDTEELIVSC